MGGGGGGGRQGASSLTTQTDSEKISGYHLLFCHFYIVFKEVSFAGAFVMEHKSFTCKYIYITKFKCFFTIISFTLQQEKH